MIPTVYILTNGSRTVLYVGVTSNLEERTSRHESGEFSGFTQQYCVIRLVYFEQFQSIHDAIDREKWIKGKSRRGKIILVEAINPNWDDLARK